MTTFEEKLAALTRVLNERGYLVVQSRNRCKPGDLIVNVSIYGFHSGSPAYVLCETDRADFLEQLRLAGEPLNSLGKIAVWPYFHRVSVD